MSFDSFVYDVILDLHYEFFKDEEAEEHSIRVANKFKDVYPNANHLYIAALLHDVVEDTNYTIEELEKRYTPELKKYFKESEIDELFDVIDILTRPKDMKYFDYIKLIKENDNATKIKFFDLQDNLTRCFKKRKGSLTERYCRALANLLLETEN